MKKLTLLSLFITALAITGCGSDANTEIHQSNTTMGQELIDLDNSYKQGIITEKEYKNAKEEILERYDN